MKHFLKAVLLSFRYKWSILIATVSAFCVAGLWGMSISTVYPLVEVIFEGNTIHTWLEEGIVRAERQETRLRREIEDLQQQAKAAAPDQRGPLSAQIAVREGHLRLQVKARKWYQSMEPWAARWAPASPFGTLALVMGLLAGATAVKGLFLVLNEYTVARVASGTVMDMRRLFFAAMLKMDQARIDAIGTDKLMAMFSHNVQLVHAGLASLYGKAVREPLKIITCLVIACAISWQLLLISLVITPLGWYVVHSLSKRMKKASGREIQGFAAIFRTVTEAVTAIKIVKIFTGQRTERRRFKQDVRTLNELTLRLAFYDALNRPVTEFVGILTLAIAILSGAYLVLNQQTHLFGVPIRSQPLSAGEMFTFFAMLAGIADPARKLGGIYNVLVRGCVAGESLYPTFEATPQIATSPDAVRAPVHCRSICFRNVTFGYDPEEPVIRGLSLEIPFGQTVALVGPNGSGKSTLVNLLARFYDPQEGDILLDGVNLRDLRPRQLHKQIAVVAQDPILFRGTIWTNLQYGDFGATEERIRRAAYLARVTEFVNELPGRFHTQVGERGGLLSGGQRQRVALARAILNDPRILILDEPTGQIDTQTEAILHESLRAFLRDRTVILITHRQSTLAMADRVIVMEAGRIVEDAPPSAIRLTTIGPGTVTAKAG